MGPYHCNVGSPKREGPGNDITQVTLDDPFAALLDNELSLSLSPARKWLHLNHRTGGKQKQLRSWKEANTCSKILF